MLGLRLGFRIRISESCRSATVIPSLVPYVGNRLNSTWGKAQPPKGILAVRTCGPSMGKGNS